MRPKTTPKPPQMTWPKATLILAIALVFDGLRFLFEQLWLFGPALLAAGCASVLGGGDATALACTAAGGAVGVLGFEAFQPFGILMGMAIGILGWLTVGVWILTGNGRLVRDHAASTLWLMGSLLVSETPIIGGIIPILSITVWRLYVLQIKSDKQKLAAWEAEELARRKAEVAGNVARARAILADAAARRNAEEEIPDGVATAT